MTGGTSRAPRSEPPGARKGYWWSALSAIRNKAGAQIPSFWLKLDFNVYLPRLRAALDVHDDDVPQAGHDGC